MAIKRTFAIVDADRTILACGVLAELTEEDLYELWDYAMIRNNKELSKKLKKCLA